MQFQRIVCVCTGNICRSPLAAGLLKKQAPALTVSSAGIGAVVGGEMPAEAARIAQREALDLADHRGRQIDAAILRENDLVLVMESGQRAWLAKHFPESMGRVFLASHWRGGADIDDPYGQQDAFFERIFAEIQPCIKDWATRLAPQ